MKLVPHPEFCETVYCSMSPFDSGQAVMAYESGQNGFRSEPNGANAADAGPTKREKCTFKFFVSQHASTATGGTHLTNEAFERPKFS